MINVLIVDDEPYIRQGLKIIIDWSQYGYSVVAEADNGVKALQILKKEKIDLVIVDIKMPEMNGFELIEQVRSEIHNNHFKFIILSGYYEFEYAKQAIHNQVAEYLRKPINKDELIRALIKIRAEFCLREETLIIEKTKDKIMNQQHLMNIIKGRFDSIDVEQTKKYISSCGSMRYINFECNECDERFSKRTSQEKRDIQKSTFLILEELVGEYAGNVICGVDKGKTIYDIGFILMSRMCGKSYSSEKGYINRLVSVLEKRLGFNFSIFIGRKVDCIEKLSDSYNSTTIVRLLHKSCENQSVIEYYDDITYKKCDHFGIGTKLLESFICAVKNNQINEIEVCVDKIYAELVEKLVEPKIVINNIYYLLYRLADLSKEFDNSDNQEKADQYISQQVFEKIATRGNSEYFKQFVIEYAEYLYELKNNNSKGVLPKMEKYITENYMENLSLKSLGEKFYINSVYLGQIFKKEYGVSFNNYLTNLRMNHASIFLKTTDLRVYTIASSVGFNNPDYFINKFMQVKGITPHQFRLNCKNEN